VFLKNFKPFNENSLQVFASTLSLKMNKKLQVHFVYSSGQLFGPGEFLKKLPF